MTGGETPVECPGLPGPGCGTALLRLRAQRAHTPAAVQGESGSCGPFAPLGRPALGWNFSPRATFGQLGTPRVKAQHKPKLQGTRE